MINSSHQSWLHLNISSGIKGFIFPFLGGQGCTETDLFPFRPSLHYFRSHRDQQRRKMKEDLTALGKVSALVTSSPQ